MRSRSTTARPSSAGKNHHRPYGGKLRRTRLDNEPPYDARSREYEQSQKQVQGYKYEATDNAKTKDRNPPSNADSSLTRLFALQLHYRRGEA
jgi:hypothetical protein